MRIAWWACVSVLLALSIALFATARTAHASILLPGQAGTPSIALSPDNEEAGGEADGEDGESGEGDEETEGEDDEGESEEEESPSPPADCLLQTAHAQVFAYPAQGKVRLLIHYTSTAPTEATVVYRLAGSRGSLRLGASRQHLGRSGSIRLSERLGESAMSKVTAARTFTVEFRIPSTPRSCRKLDSRRLTVERGDSRRKTWLQSGSR